MKVKHLLAALCLGAGFGSSWRLVSTMVDAAPKDVVGSTNVAVDTYNNSRGSFVLMSDGTIFSLKNGKTAAGITYVAGQTDLGHPFNDPPATASMTPPTAAKGKVTGSPNIAVKALVRSDGTFVVFADGTAKQPANSDAAAAMSTPRILTGTLTQITGTQPGFSVGSYAGHGQSIQLTGDGFKIANPNGVGNGNPGEPKMGLTVTFDTPFSSPPAVTFSGPPYYTTAYVSRTDGFDVLFYPLSIPGTSNQQAVQPFTSAPQMTFVVTGN